VAVHLPLDLLSLHAFVHEPEDLPIRPEYTSRLDAGKLPSILPLTLVQYPFEEGFKGPARNGLHYPGKILSYIFIVLVKSQLSDSTVKDGKQKGNKVYIDRTISRLYRGKGDYYRYSPYLYSRIRRNCPLDRGNTLAGKRFPL
jgi:hypothetical protein